MKTLTGRTRYRSAKVGLFGPTVLVLQVEERRSDGLPDWDGLPEYLADTYWRDATAMDLSSVIRMTPTNKLRFVQRYQLWDKSSYEIYKTVRVLQQWWSAEGDERDDIVAAGGEWLDVPTEVES